MGMSDAFAAALWAGDYMLTLAANGSPELIAALCVLAIVLALLPLSGLGIAWRLWRRPA